MNKTQAVRHRGKDIRRFFPGDAAFAQAHHVFLPKTPSLLMPRELQR
jgi:hypothetical protein